MKVYLDDERTAPDGWIQVRWPEEAIRLLESGEVTELSLDHDLGDDAHGSGYDVVLWIEHAVATRRFRPPHIKVHSANPSARMKMESGIKSIEQLSVGKHSFFELDRTGDIMKTLFGVDAIFGIFVMLTIGMINRFIRATFGVIAVCLAIFPLVLICSNWELTPWIRQHAFSLLVVIFVFQLILPAGPADTVSLKLPPGLRP